MSGRSFTSRHSFAVLCFFLFSIPLSIFFSVWFFLKDGYIWGNDTSNGIIGWILLVFALVTTSSFIGIISGGAWQLEERTSAILFVISIGIAVYFFTMAIRFGDDTIICLGFLMLCLIIPAFSFAIMLNTDDTEENNSEINYKQKKHTQKEKIIEKKALQLLLNTVGFKNFKALKEGKMISIEASNRYVYGVDLKGRIAKYRKSRIFEEEKESGYLWSDSIPIADCVTSFYVWAKNNPQLLEKKWGCGSIVFRDKTRR